MGGCTFVLRPEGENKSLSGKTTSNSWNFANVKALNEAAGKRGGGSLRDEKAMI